MKQSLLNRAVARATGEPVRHIRRLGFSLLTLAAPDCQDAAEGTDNARPAHSQGADRDVPTPAA